MTYNATKDGRITGIRTPYLEPTVHHTGYAVVTIKRKQHRVHRYIWEFFNGNVPEGYCINHIDGNKLNNRLDNLECITFQENTQHAFSLGLMQGLSGESNSKSKLTDAEALQMFSLFSTHSNQELGRIYGLHPQYISLIRHKRRWKRLWQQYEASETISQESTLQA